MVHLSVNETDGWNIRPRARPRCSSRSTPALRSARRRISQALRSASPDALQSALCERRVPGRLQWTDRLRPYPAGSWSSARGGVHSSCGKRRCHRHQPLRRYARTDVGVRDRSMSADQAAKPAIQENIPGTRLQLLLKAISVTDRTRKPRPRIAGAVRTLCVR